MSGVVILHFFEIAYHFAVGNMKDTMKMQSVIIFTTLPYADILPPVTSNKVFKRVG